MVKTTKFILYFETALLLLITYCSCSNKDNNVLSDGDILTFQNWKRGTVDKNPATNPGTDSHQILYGPIPTCQQDDVLRFGKDSTLVINNGTNKCEDGEGATKSVKYAYDETNKELTIDGVKYKVAEVSASQIKYYAELSFTATGYSYLVYLLQPK